LALLPVTKRSKASVSRTAVGIVTRCVVWVAADCAEARKLMTSAAAAGVTGRTDNPRATIKLPRTSPTMFL
jgi:hypothetical protein